MDNKMVILNAYYLMLWCVLIFADKERMNISRVLVIYTGGTIGMTIDENGSLSPAKNALTDYIRQSADLNDGAYSETDILSLPQTEKNKRILYVINEYDPLQDSSNVDLDDWKRIATNIEKDYYNYDGFVVLHGTDTLEYSATALSFMLEHLEKPVIFTGSQISIFSLRSDARQNLVTSILLAGMFQIPEVCIFFYNKLMRANRVIKYSAQSFDAFQTVSFPPLAITNTGINVNWENIWQSTETDKFSIFTEFNTNVTILRLHPNMKMDELDILMNPGIEGVVLETFGMGDIPTNRVDIRERLAKAIEDGVIIINISQCPHSVISTRYETGKVAENAGLISGSDMTSTAAYIKLCYVLGKKELTLNEKKIYMQNNLRGELTDSQMMADNLISITEQTELPTRKYIDMESFLISHKIRVDKGERKNQLNNFQCNSTKSSSDGIFFKSCLNGSNEITKYALNQENKFPVSTRTNRTSFITLTSVMIIP